MNMGTPLVFRFNPYATTNPMEEVVDHCHFKTHLVAAPPKSCDPAATTDRPQTIPPPEDMPGVDHPSTVETHHSCGAINSTTEHLATASPSMEKMPCHHSRLSGKCAFHTFPPTTSIHLASTNDQQAPLIRVFFGQLPYQMAPEHLVWVCSLCAPDVVLHDAQTILKSVGRAGRKMPTGCMHAYVREDDVHPLLEALSHRVLVDEGGVWCTATLAEREQLESYCVAMKENEELRPRDRPYQPIVVQVATSSHTKKIKKPRSRPASMVDASSPGPSSGISTPEPANTSPRQREQVHDKQRAK